MNVSTEQLFTEARTQNGFFADPIPETKLRELYDLMKWGPTSANCSPARFIFVSSTTAKDKLVPCMSPGNQAKTRQAPVTADERLRRREGRRGVLGRHDGQDQLHLQPRPRRPGQGLRTQPAPRLRRGMPD